MSSDEGIHLMWLRLLAAGYQPYSEVYITYPPLYPLAIEAVWNVWPTETAQRWFSVAYTLFGTVGIALLARKFAGDIAGLAAAALTVLSPVLMEPSRAVLGEFPSVAWSVWAVWLAWLYKDGGKYNRLWLILSGLCLSVSLLTKLLSPFLLGLIPLFILVRWYKTRTGSFLKNFRWNPIVIDSLFWGLALLLPVVMMFFIYNPGALLNQVVDQRLEARVAYTADHDFWHPRLEPSLQFVTEDTVLTILAFLGLIYCAIFRKQKERWIFPAWLGLALVMLAIHDPVRYKHFLILIPPFAVLGGAVLNYWTGNLQLLATNNWRRLYGLAPLIATLAGFIILTALSIWQIPAAVNLWHIRAEEAGIPPDEQEALAFINTVTAPHDCLITDDMQLVYWSGRMVPPELAEVSSNRLDSGALSLDELITISDQYDCQIVAAVSNRIPKYLPEYMDWVKRKYLGMYHYGEDDLFFAKADTDPVPKTPLWTNFADEFIFHGYTMPDTPAHPGDIVPLTLVWEARQPPSTDYAIFVQLRDAHNNTLVHADHQPYKALIPTSRWPAGAVIPEVTWLPLPADIPAGNYQIYAGLYRPDTLERLPLIDDTSGENALILGPLVVR